LYEAIEKLGNQLLYCDTDSVIYVSNPSKKSNQEIELGDFLGDYTDKLNGGHISEFVSTGCKSYSYLNHKTDGVQCVTKMKGFTLNYENSFKINHEEMKKLVFEKDYKIETFNKCKIKRDLKTKEIKSVSETKCYSMDFDKRIVMDDYDTLPYGF